MKKNFIVLGLVSILSLFLLSGCGNLALKSKYDSGTQDSRLVGIHQDYARATSSDQSSFYSDRFNADGSITYGMYDWNYPESPDILAWRPLLDEYQLAITWSLNGNELILRDGDDYISSTIEFQEGGFIRRTFSSGDTTRYLIIP